ncbi:MAG: SelT/SelW/SelH family protein [Planctomycetes bacterium]|nr:SelT/SelW/SelH family protein [Planctomycetota bacterium]
MEYCELGNYERVARGLVEAVRGEFLGSRIAAEVRPASGGVFEVAVGGKLVFSKKATARLPEPEEIFYHVQASLCCHPPGPPEGGGSV